MHNSGASRRESANAYLELERQCEEHPDDGLVSRKAVPTVPVTVECWITSLGRTFSATVDGLRIWAEIHIDKVLKAQKQYDAGLQRKAA